MYIKKNIKKKKENNSITIKEIYECSKHIDWHIL